MKKMILIMFSILFLSCSSEHDIYINKDNSASVKFSVNNKESLVETLKEWGAVQNDDNNELIDINQLKTELESDKNIYNVNVKKPKQNSYEGSFKVYDIEKLFNDSKKNIPTELQVFSLKKTDSSKILSIKLSLENYKYLKQTLPILNEESIDMLGPDANQNIDKEEYLDMMSFSLGDNGPKDILSSYINLNISVDGIILSTEGGILTKNNSVLFKVPLIDLILLKQTLIYSITYN